MHLMVSADALLFLQENASFNGGSFWLRPSLDSSFCLPSFHACAVLAAASTIWANPFVIAFAAASLRREEGILDLETFHFGLKKILYSTDKPK